MLAWQRTTWLLLLTSSLVRAQLAIENPKHLNMPESQAQALFVTTTRVMEKEFNAPGALENKFHMKLVIGEKPERFTIDDVAGNGTLYLERWNEFKFTTVTMRLAIQQLLVPERQQRMLDVIVRRAHEIAPVSAAELHDEKIMLPQPPAQGGCLGQMTNAAVAGIPCKPGQGFPQNGPMRLR
jgi:hypothetical protein